MSRTLPTRACKSPSICTLATLEPMGYSRDNAAEIVTVLVFTAVTNANSLMVSLKINGAVKPLKSLFKVTVPAALSTLK